MNIRNIGKKLTRTFLKQKAFLAIVIMYIVMAFFPTKFFSGYNQLGNILFNNSANLIIAAGVTIVVICAGCDLSIGGMLSLSGIVAIQLMNFMPMVLAILCSLALGVVVGFINGFFVAHQKSEPFIITLGMGMALKGVSQQLTNAHPISPANIEFMNIANGMAFGVIPNLVIIMLVVMVIIHLILRFTQFGRNCYAVGGDYEVAVYAGINARRTKWAAFIISGVTAAIGGILLSSKLNSGNSIFGDNTPLIIHCGAVIGGTSLIGGKGGIPQTFIGLLALGILTNCMNMLQICIPLLTPYVQQLIQGAVIVGILWLDCYGIKRKREAV